MDETAATQQSLKVAWIGTGVMGASMAGHLLRAGNRVRVHSRTKAKAQALLDSGAEWADDPASAAEGVDAAFCMVGTPEEVEDVCLGARGMLAARRVPRVIVDMSTSRPSLARRLANEATKRGAGSVDAPVSGGDVGARNAALSIMVGGEAKDVAVVMPLFEKMGTKIVHQGSAGAGQHAKMVNQILIAANMVGVCESLLYAKRAGLDPAKVIDSVASGAAGSWTISNLGPRIVRGDFEPGFQVEHFIKDLGIALDEAAELGVPTPGVAMAKRLYDQVRELGYARKGTQALYLALEKMVGQHAGSE